MTHALLTLRHATPADAEALAAFAARTFDETFGPDNDPRHIAAHLAASFGPEQQRRELCDPAMVTLILETGAVMAGYAMVRRQEPPPCVADRAAIELWRFYVDRPWHGRGAARQLMAGVFDVADSQGATAVWLSVWERNPRARAFYGKCGFKDVGAGDFWLGSERQSDRILVAPVAPRHAAPP